MRHTHVPTSSILLILGSVLCFTMLDTITKYMTQRYSVPLLVWARYTVQFLAMLLWLGPSMRLRLFQTERLPLQVVRGGVLLASSLFFVGALRSLPLANATALNYTTPVLVVLMARFVLGERMTPARIAFVVAGLAGMLLIVRPGSDVFRGASLLALLAALCYASYQIMTRVLHGERPQVLLFYPAVVGAAVMTALAPWLEWPSRLPWQHAVLIVAGGLLGTLGHFLFILAFQHGPASALTPFTYMQLVWATLMGWVVYGYFPDGMTVAGMGVIGLSGLLITLHQRRHASTRVTGPVTVQ